MYKFFLVVVVLLLSSHLESIAQNYIYRGDKQYPATSKWMFGFGFELTVAKHDNGGYVMVSSMTYSKSSYISGTLFLFLNDGSIIKCTDRGIRDYVDSKSIALYNLTRQEIGLLKQYRITKVRYSITQRGFGTESHTADNEMPTGGRSYSETDLEISELFGEY